MELHPVQAPGRILGRRHRRPRRAGGDGEAGGRAACRCHRATSRPAATPGSPASSTPPVLARPRARPRRTRRSRSWPPRRQGRGPSAGSRSRCPSIGTPGLEQPGRRGRRPGRVHRRRPAGQDDRGWVALQNILGRRRRRHDLRVNLALAHAPRDELGVLGAEVHHQYRPRGAGRADRRRGLSGRTAPPDPGAASRRGIHRVSLLGSRSRSTWAAADRAASVTLTLAIRRPSSSVTVSRLPSSSADSPACGRWPSAASRKPATVSYGPSGSSIPVCSAKSSRFISPSTSISPSRSRRDAWPSSTSYSSWMSPISSSTRSSSVTIPAVPPYSSTTMARWARSRRISDRADITVLLVGSIFTGRLMSPTRAGRGCGSGSSRSRACTKPITSS